MITIDSKAFEAWAKEAGSELHGKAERALLLTAQATAFHARGTKLFNDKTGALRKSIRGELNGGDLEARTIANAKHAFWVENGNKPLNSDRIYPKNGKYLVFELNGVTQFRTSVKPADPRPFMHAAREAAVPLFERLMAAGITGALGG